MQNVVCFRTRGEIECTWMSIHSATQFCWKPLLFSCKCVFSVCYLPIWLELMFLTTSGTGEIWSIDVTQITQPADCITDWKICPQIELKKKSHCFAAFCLSQMFPCSRKAAHSRIRAMMLYVFCSQELDRRHLVARTLPRLLSATEQISAFGWTSVSSLWNQSLLSPFQVLSFFVYSGECSLYFLPLCLGGGENRSSFFFSLVFPTKPGKFYPHLHLPPS